MLRSLRRYLALAAQAKTGASPGFAAWAVLAALAFMAALVAFAVAAYIWLSGLYGALTAALILAGFFVAVLLLSGLIAVLVRRHTKASARRALRARRAAIDPSVIVAGVEIGRALGLEKTLPIALVGVFAAGIAREWSADRDKD